MNFNTPFIIYIDPYEKSYINIIFSKDDNMDIIEEMSNKYLIENKEYYLLDSKKLMIRIDENFDSNINILEDENIKYILNKNNPFVEIDSPNDNLVIVSEQNTIIELYRNISYLFPEEYIDIIEYPIDKKGEIMIIHILSYESKDYCFFNLISKIRISKNIIKINNIFYKYNLCLFNGYYIYFHNFDFIL